MESSKKQRLVVFSGAGMSAESGIATFRGAGGLWEGYRLEEVATPEAWDADPDLVTRFYNIRRKQVMEATPNEGHLAIARLEHAFEVNVVTQNIDDLHERAGSRKVLHLHGELMVIRSECNAQHKVRIQKWEVTAGDRCPEGGRMRPDVVWFGEAVPMIEPAVELIARADVLIVVGTSLVVYPAAGLLHYARRDTRVYVIDPFLEDVPAHLNATMIRKGAVEGLRELSKELLEKP